MNRIRTGQYLGFWLTLAFLHWGWSYSAPPDYELFFGRDYKQAVKYCQRHSADFALAGALTDTEPALLVSVIFPEAVRYSLMRDLMETRVLEFAYVNYGTRASDFSIGEFQMRPSFIEQLEEEIRKGEPWLCKDLLRLIEYGDTAALEIRRLRIERLKNFDWQLGYLCAFCRLIQYRFEHTPEYQGMGRLRFTAAAYNGGFRRSAALIREVGQLAQFPYGKGYAPESQCVYADVALDFYERYAKFWF